MIRKNVWRYLKILRAVIWEQICPNADKIIKSNQILLSFLTKSKHNPISHNFHHLRWKHNSQASSNDILQCNQAFSIWLLRHTRRKNHTHAISTNFCLIATIRSFLLNQNKSFKSLCFSISRRLILCWRTINNKSVFQSKFIIQLYSYVGTLNNRAVFLSHYPFL